MYNAWHNSNFPGNNVNSTGDGSVVVSDSSACRTLCDNEVQCVMYVFHTLTRQCWIKSRLDPTTAQPLSGTNCYLGGWQGPYLHWQRQRQPLPIVD